MNEETHEHENITVARLDAAKFIINHFGKEGEKPEVYNLAVAHIADSLKKPNP